MCSGLFCLPQWYCLPEFWYWKHWLQQQWKLQLRVSVIQSTWLQAAKMCSFVHPCTEQVYMIGCLVHMRNCKRQAGVFQSRLLLRGCGVQCNLFVTVNVCTTGLETLDPSIRGMSTLETSTMHQPTTETSIREMPMPEASTQEAKIMETATLATRMTAQEILATRTP